MAVTRRRRSNARAVATADRDRPGGRSGRIARKNYRIDVDKLTRARRVLGTSTETETIHRALDLVVNEAALAEAVRDFIRLGQGHIEDMDASRH